MVKTCGHCLAETKQGKMCKRLATCKIGCDYFCFQHAKMFGGTYAPKKACEENLKSCVYDDEGRVYPCKAANTVFFKDSDFEEYFDLLRAEKPMRTKTPPKRRRKSKKKKSAKKVRFA